jgi:hypothetical protein
MLDWRPPMFGCWVCDGGIDPLVLRLLCRLGIGTEGGLGLVAKSLGTYSAVRNGRGLRGIARGIARIPPLGRPGRGLLTFRGIVSPDGETVVAKSFTFVPGRVPICPDLMLNVLALGSGGALGPF